MTQACERCAHKRCFAGAEIAEELHVQTGKCRHLAHVFERLRETCTERLRGGEIIEHEVALDQYARRRMKR
jgi:hypothetical protein